MSHRFESWLYPSPQCKPFQLWPAPKLSWPVETRPNTQKYNLYRCVNSEKMCALMISAIITGSVVSVFHGCNSHTNTSLFNQSSVEMNQREGLETSLSTPHNIQLKPIITWIMSLIKCVRVSKCLCCFLIWARKEKKKTDEERDTVPNVELTRAKKLFSQSLTATRHLSRKGNKDWFPSRCKYKGMTLGKRTEVKCVGLVLCEDHPDWTQKGVFGEWNMSQWSMVGVCYVPCADMMWYCDKLWCFLHSLFLWFHSVG